MAPADARASIGSLSLKDFRNFERLELELPPAGFVVTGESVAPVTHGRIAIS